VRFRRFASRAEKVKNLQVNTLLVFTWVFTLIFTSFASQFGIYLGKYLVGIYVVFTSKILPKVRTDK